MLEVSQYTSSIPQVPTLPPSGASSQDASAVPRPCWTHRFRSLWWNAQVVPWSGYRFGVLSSPANPDPMKCGVANRFPAFSLGFSRPRCSISRGSPSNIELVTIPKVKKHTQFHTEGHRNRSMRAAWASGRALQLFASLLVRWISISVHLYRFIFKLNTNSWGA